MSMESAENSVDMTTGVVNAIDFGLSSLHRQSTKNFDKKSVIIKITITTITIATIATINRNRAIKRERPKTKQT